MEKSLDFDYIFKYILIGDTSVGKSTILNSFINNTFIADCNPTMGVEFATKKINLGKKIIKIQIWDTAGQESFRTITRAYYKNAIGIILVYDVNDHKSMDSIQSWLKEIYDNSNEKAQIVLVGNKSDLNKSKDIKSPKEQFTFYTTSAKTNTNITKMFTSLTDTILKKIDSGQINPQNVSGIKKGSTSGQSQEIKLKNIEFSSDGEKKGCC